MSEAGHGWIGRLVCIALALLSSACASNQLQAPPSQAVSVIEAPRSERGNPPFYEVFGKRYHVLGSGQGYRERGIASWYGRDFHGQPTSGGERYDMYAMTAAHKTLPIPTWVEVKNLSNGKRVIVKVNDRGPFVAGRIIDLSYTAAEQIDMIGAGTARVEVRALGTPPAATPASTQAAERGFSIISEAVADVPSPTDQPFRQLYIQVGAFSERGNAADLTDRLKQHGFADSFVVSSPDALHRVRIGPLASAEHFDRVNNDLKSLGVEGGHVVTEN